MKTLLTSRCINQRGAGQPHNQYTSIDDKHWIDSFLYMVGSLPVLLTLWLLSIVIGGYCSYITNDGAWMTRFSALGVLMGTLLTLSPLFRNGLFTSQAIGFGLGSIGSDGKTAVTSEESRKTSMNVLYGVVIIVISSVINAFGDLMFKP